MAEIDAYNDSHVVHFLESNQCAYVVVGTHVRDCRHGPSRKKPTTHDEKHQVS